MYSFSYTVIFPYPRLQESNLIVHEMNNQYFIVKGSHHCCLLMPKLCQIELIYKCPEQRVGSFAPFNTSHLRLTSQRLFLGGISWLTAAGEWDYFSSERCCVSCSIYGIGLRPVISVSSHLLRQFCCPVLDRNPPKLQQFLITALLCISFYLTREDDNKSVHNLCRVSLDHSFAI